MKRFLSIFLTICLILTVLPFGFFSISVSAVSNENFDFTYTISNGNATITNCKIPSNGVVTVPRTIGGYLVTGIGSDAFTVSSTLKSITLPDSITTIEAYAFYWCENLESINLGNNITNIGNYAFFNCKSLKNIALPSSLKSVGTSAFERCYALSNVYINDVASWCEISFSNNYSNPLYTAEYLYLNNEYITELIIPNGVEHIAKYAFYGWSNCNKITIPSSVKSISDSAFANCRIYKVNICDVASWCEISFSDRYSNPLEYAGNLYLNDVSVNELIIPEGVVSISNYAFENCDGITSVKFPSSVKNVGERAFYSCSGLATISFSDGITNIGKSAFCGCSNLINVTIPDSVTSIGESAFDSCGKLSNIYIGKGVSNISENEFDRCSSLENIYVSSDNSKYCDINGVLFSADKKTLWFYPEGNKTALYEIPIGTTKIEEFAFESCKELVKIAVPNSVISVSSYAFADCENLSTVYYMGSEAEKSDIAIDHNNNIFTSATWYYNCCAHGQHLYKNICDSTCENCKFERENEGHKYDNDADIECNRCNNERKIPSRLNVYFRIENESIIPIVTYDNLVLVEDLDYQCTYIEENTKLYITGLNDYEGITLVEQIKTIKKSIVNTNISIASCSYKGYPLEPKVTIMDNNLTLVEDKDYTIEYYDNTNVGTGRVVIAGKGLYCGYVEKTFEIANWSPNRTSETFYAPSTTSTSIVAGKITLDFDCIKSYILYNSTGGIISNKSYSAPGATNVNINFSDLPSGTYFLYYYIQGSGVLSRPGSINPYYYTGVEKEYCVTITNTAVYQPTTKEPTRITPSIPYEIDEKTLLLSVFANSSIANLDNIVWSSDNDDVGNVANGILTLKKPGDITVKALVNDLEASWELHIEALDLAKKGEILNFHPESNQTTVVYNGNVLEKDVDYTIEKVVYDDCIIVTVKGQNLFTGEICKLFYKDSGNPYCAKSITVTDYPKKLEYRLNNDDLDLTGLKVSVNIDQNKNIVVTPTREMISNFDNTVEGEQEVFITCYGCQTSFKVNVKDYIPGDIDGVKGVTSADAEYMLMHTFFPEDYPVNQSCDFNGDGKVNDADAEHLLMFTVSPEDYPLMPTSLPATTTGSCSINGNSSVTVGSNIEFIIDVSGCVDATSIAVAIDYSDNFEFVSGTWLKTGSIIKFDTTTNKGALGALSSPDVNGNLFKVVLKAKTVSPSDQNVSVNIIAKNGSTEIMNVISSKGVKIDCVTHSYGTYENKDTNNHNRTCTVCGNVESSAHTLYVEIANNTAIKKCIDCGYEEYISDGWLQNDSNLMFFVNGQKATGWKFIDANWYYFDLDGKMQTGWLLDGVWYYLADNGAMVTGWQNFGGTWYYFNQSGAMQTGWLLDGVWYYLADNGAMVDGWQYIGNTWYYFSGGAMQTGWLYQGGTWYYLADGGNMVTGWQYIGSSWYYFNNGGNMATGWLLQGNTWYYLAEGGNMLTDWQYISGNWYYFYNSGAMAANCWIGNYWINANGVWI